MMAANERNSAARKVPLALPLEIYLVGAGPGDPGLITVAGAALIARADVIVYDYLANVALLAGARLDAERIYVGKKGFSAHVTQDEINDLLVKKACELKARGAGVLVRLKGGDPFVFGRGGEEALALAAAGFSCAVVPGVTSGVAAPAFAGVPVTHRGLSSSVAFITGNEDPTKDETSIDWDGIAHGADTLCFYMGVRNLEIIARRLMKAGRRADTPVILVRWATMPHQEVLEGTLITIAERARSAHFKAPAIIVVGEVAGLREQLAWYKPGPLAGLTVAVTRARVQASTLTMQLQQLGANVVELPTIEIEPLSNYDEVDAAIKGLANYRFAVFTSANGVQAFFERLAVANLDARALACVRIVAIGPATAAELASRGIIADLVPREYRGEAAAELLIAAGLSSGDRVLIPRALEAREVLPRMLEEQGARVDVVPVYRTVPPSGASVESAFRCLAAQEVDAVVFTSSSTVRNFVTLARRYLPADSDFKALEFYSIGPITTQTAEEEGLSVAVQAESYTMAGLVDAIVGHRAKTNVPRAAHQAKTNAPRAAHQAKTNAPKVVHQAKTNALEESEGGK